MNKVTLCEDTLDPSTWTEHNVADVRKFLVDHFGIWPESARIYLTYVAKNADITPMDDAGVERLGKIDNSELFVVVYPEGIETILLVVALVVAAVAIGLSFLLRPSVNTKPNQQASPNNSLADRQNTARPNERIPDIFGQLWATFDLLAVPYRTFVNNSEEFEHCFMCIGRGAYSLLATDIRDDITAFSQILGAAAGVFDPGTSPLNGSAALTVGTYVPEAVVNLQTFGAVNGQTVQAPNVNSRKGNNNIRFVFPNIIEVNTGGGAQPFIYDFFAGDQITIGGLVTNDDLATDPSSVQPPLHLNGTYTIDFLDTPVGAGFKRIRLLSPATVNANWTSLAAFHAGAGDSNYASINLLANGVFAVGPFTLLYPQMTELWANFVCENGCYKIDSDGNQQIQVVTVQISIQACDGAGTPIGVPLLFTTTLQENTTHDRVYVGSTLKCVLPAGFAASGGVIVIGKRTSDTDFTAGMQVSDQTQWRDCYIITPTGLTNYGNVTTVQTVIQNTASAAAVKTRKMNALVTRKLPALVGGVFVGLVATKNAADIICAMALDPFIGNRSLAELDVTGIYALAGIAGAIETYFTVFGTPSAVTEFCYTFDDTKVSFEESLADVATSIFCVAYRRGNVITLSFERKTINSTLLFNHRNKIPKSGTRTITFGAANDQDGIILDYIEPNAPNYPNLDTTVSLYFPPDKSARNPKKITSIGIRNVYQATLLGWRLYYKLTRQNTLVQFDATSEAALSVLNDRILVADNTRQDVQDGDVFDQTALQLTLSQNVTFIAGLNYTIFLQHPDETVEAIAITAGANPNQVVLATAPTTPCVVDIQKYARTTYLIVNDALTRSAAFLLTEKAAKDNQTYEVKAVNYDDNYYLNDNNFVTNVDVNQLVLEVKANVVVNADVVQLVLEVKG